MKFLSLCTLKDSFSMLPPATGRQLLELTLSWSDQQRKDGKILELYAMPGAKTTMAICEHPSAEDLNQTLITMPLYGFMDFEIYPLSDIGHSMKASIESMKAAERMMPAGAREPAGVR